MAISDLVFYLMDAAILGMFFYMFFNSKKVVVEAKSSNQWVVSLMFAGIGIYGFFVNEGAFRVIQTSVLLLIAVLYLMLKSGLSEDGIVMTGSLLKYEKAGKINLSKKDSCIYFANKGRTISLQFEPEKIEEAREFLKHRSS